MLCIYCNERKANAREHYLPQCLGRFSNFEPLRDRLCQDCNQEIGNAVEREFCRSGPEGVLRSAHWIKGQNAGKKRRKTHIFQPEKIGGRHVYFFARDPESGRDILWQHDVTPGTAKEISQIIILDAQDNAVEYIPIPTEISTGRELVEILFKQRNVSFIDKAQVIAASGDEARVDALFSEINVPILMQRRKAGNLPRQFFTGEITPAYFRALAKIGVHYAIKYVPTITGAEGSFRSVREFIRRGVGDGGVFLSSCDSVLDVAGLSGHYLKVVATPERIIIDMQFFVGCKPALPQWRLTLESDPAAQLLHQVSGHFFVYAQDEEGRLTGGEVVPLQFV